MCISVSSIEKKVPILIKYITKFGFNNKIYHYAFCKITNVQNVTYKTLFNIINPIDCFYEVSENQNFKFWIPLKEINNKLIVHKYNNNLITSEIKYFI